MENATKALLIAAAVLVAIIIISLTLGVVRQGQEAIHSVDMSEAEIEAHNAKFKAYEGSNVAASEVNVLLSTVLSHNQQAEEGAKITLSGNSGAAVNTETGKVTKVSTQSRYTVTTTMANGIITGIEINSNTQQQVD